MSPDRKAREAEFMAALNGQFRARCAAEAARLDAFLRGETPREDLLAALHRIAGSGGTFGHPDLSEQAFALDEAVRAHEPDRAALKRLRDALKEISSGD